MFRKTKTNRKNRTLNRKAPRNLGLQPLEDRQLMAADISLSGSVLEITGTDNRDLISVDNTSQTYYMYNWATGQITSYEMPAVTATVRDASGNVDVQQTFGWTTYISQVRAYGLDGNDEIRNNTALPSLQYGGDGDDRLYGGSSSDNLQGGNHNDRLYGYEGDDSLYGQGGNDSLYGYGGNDYLSGSSGNDYLSASSGDDTLYGSSGNDTLYGGSGDDYINAGSGDDYAHAGSGDDTVYGSSGKDTLYGSSGSDFLDGGNQDDYVNGGSGDDRLEGGSGNDDLRGESGRDRLYGQSGNDNLEGGEDDDGLWGGSGADDLNGGGGDDRFLRLYDQPGFLGILGSADDVEDRQGNDAEIKFFNSVDSIFSDFSGKSWTQAEIEEVDEAFDILMRRTGNTNLVQKSDGGDFEVHRYGVNGDDGSVLGVNNDSRIGMFDGAFQGTDSTRPVYVMLHEVGHFWDEAGENSFVNEFRAESGWEGMPWFGGVPSGHTASGDGNWIFDNGSDFVSVYGSWNPKEDWAECFAVNMMLDAGYDFADGGWDDMNDITPNRVNAAGDKLDIVDDFIATKD